MIELRELIVILDLHKEGLTISAIAERTGLDRKTVRKYIERGLEAPVYGPREPRARIMEPYEAYVQERLSAWCPESRPTVTRQLDDKNSASHRVAHADKLTHPSPKTLALTE